MTTLRVFLASSSEGKDLAERFANSLEGRGEISTIVWSSGVFSPGDHALESLLLQASKIDFAIVLLGADDKVESRSTQQHAPRDNVIFELGLFIGALGKNRTYMLHPQNIDLKLPSDLLGINQLRYDAARYISDPDRALSPAVMLISDYIKQLGKRNGSSANGIVPNETPRIFPSLRQDLRMLETSLEAQGWKFRWNQSHTTFRVKGPRGTSESLKIMPTSETQPDFDRFIRRLRGFGVRMDSTLRTRKG